MEITTDITKVFGTEMAKLFASQISEEEMNKEAREIWDKLIQRRNDGWGSSKDSVLEEKIKQILITNLQNKITEILNEPVNEEMFRNQAKEMVEKARKIAEEGIIHLLAENMVARTLSPWHDNSRIVDNVIRELHVDPNDKYR